MAARLFYFEVVTNGLFLGDCNFEPFVRVSCHDGRWQYAGMVDIRGVCVWLMVKGKKKRREKKKKIGKYRRGEERKRRKKKV